jgi:mannosidase alpha-like ER degradation enhancer 2
VDYVLTCCGVIGHRYVFSTEGHFLPMTPEISLLSDHCTYPGSYCQKDPVLEGVQSSRREKAEMEADEIVNQKVNFSLCNDSSLEVQRHSLQGTDQTEEDFQDSEGRDFTQSSVKGVCPKLSHWRQLGLNLGAD